MMHDRPKTDMLSAPKAAVKDISRLFLHKGVEPQK